MLGKYNSAESKAEYARIIAELQLLPRGVDPSPILLRTQARADVTVNEVIVAFWNHAQIHYRHPDGTPTGEQTNFLAPLRALKELYGHTPAREFGPLALKAVRERLVASGHARVMVNRHTMRIRSVFKWAASEELVPAGIFHALQTVAGLKRGRTPARECEPVKPPTPGSVEASLPYLRPSVAAMVRLQMLTGLRPGEVCRMTPAQIDATGEVWFYQPATHKTLHHGRGRRAAIGPQAQAILREHWPESPTEAFFSPAREMAAKMAERAAARKTPRYKSHMKRNAAKKKPLPQRKPGAFYTTTSYCRACQRAAHEANAPRWHPNQLRHQFATDVRKRFGLEAAQVTLGHSRADVTQVYAERDESLAERVAREVG
jgi:integrase